MLEQEACKESMKLSNFFDNLKYKFKFARENPTYFNPDGLLIFVGPQGSGKTLSAVNYVYKLMELYPNSKLVTNLMLKDYPIVTFEEWCKRQGLLFFHRSQRPDLLESEKEYLFEAYKVYNRVFPFDNADDLSRYENMSEGVIYLIDEIQLYFNSLESKNINPEVMTEISQQRKQRKHIVCTSQVFGRMAKPLREQFSSVILCGARLFGYLQCNQLLDRDSLDSESSSDTQISGKVVKKFWWWRTPKMFKRYDTYYKISRTKFVSNEEKKGDIYGRDSNDGKSSK